MCFAPQQRALFYISISKSGSSMVCFVHFDFDMCFAPQRRALFRHLNFQKWSEHGVFCTFWLRNVLRATTACTFSTSQLPKVLWTWCVLYILTSKCASCHNGVQFFSVSRLSYLFGHLDLLSSETFSFVIFFLLFSSLLFSSRLVSSRLVSSRLVSSLLFSSLLYSSPPPLLFICPYCRKFDF